MNLFTRLESVKTQFDQKQTYVAVMVRDVCRFGDKCVPALQYEKKKCYQVNSPAAR